MDGMQILIIAIATASNIIIIKWKFEHDRYADAMLDAGILVLLAIVFGGSIAGLQIATVTSAIISLYLLMSPPTKLVAKLKKLINFK